MARPSATALLLLLLSLLAVAHCRTLESDPASTDASTAETTTEVVPAGILRLPSHRRHHPCHRGLWWAHHRHHGVFGDGHRFHHRGDADELVRDADPSTRPEAEEEVKPVAEPDPDHSLTHSDEGGDGDDAAVKRWRKEVLWRMFRHGLRHHRHHHHEDDDDEEEAHHEREEEGPVGVKRFRHHHHHGNDEDEDEEKEEKMGKLFHPHADDESDEELEEVVRRFRKAIMRRRFHLHGRFFRHHHHARHHRAEEQQHEGGGVVTWIKGLMNRF